MARASIPPRVGAGMLPFLERISAIAAVIVLLLPCSQPRPFARGSQVGHDPPWNSEHIEGLPPEVRNVVIRMCRNSPRAGHYFATYFGNSHFIKLHFEHLHCDSSQYSAGKVVASTKNMFLPEATIGS
jgi:hypothetical protein